ncbi:uncharacterized protein ACWYII_031207 [Salvelinus alpinus]
MDGLCVALITLLCAVSSSQFILTLFLCYLCYLLFDTSPPESSSSSPPPVDCGLCWMLLFSLCPVSALLSSLLSSTCVYSFCRTTAPTETQVPLNRTTTRGSDSREQTTVKEEGDVCYASLENCQGQRTPKKKKKRVQNSDFGAYSAINTSRV